MLKMESEAGFVVCSNFFAIMLASLHYSNSKETGHRISTTVIVSLSRICRLGCLMTLTSGVTAVCK